MGVRYYAAFSTVAKDKAALNPNLEPVATVPDLDGKPPSGWTIYRVKDAPTVQALRNEPVVATGMQSEPGWKCEDVPEPADTGSPVAEFSPWECSAVPWFSDPSALDRPAEDRLAAQRSRGSRLCVRVSLGLWGSRRPCSLIELIVLSCDREQSVRHKCQPGEPHAEPKTDRETPAHDQEANEDCDGGESGDQRWHTQVTPAFGLLEGSRERKDRHQQTQNREERLDLVRDDLPSRAPAAATVIDRPTVQTEPSVEELADPHDSKSDHSDPAREPGNPRLPETVGQGRDEQASEIRPELVIDPWLVSGKCTEVAHRVVDEAVFIWLCKPTGGPTDDEGERRDQATDCTEAKRHPSTVAPIASRRSLGSSAPSRRRTRALIVRFRKRNPERACRSSLTLLAAGVPRGCGMRDAGAVGCQRFDVASARPALAAMRWRSIAR